MIKANELRIGNLIYEAGEQARIYQLGSGGISFYTINDIHVNKETGCTLNGGEIRFKPIPLTPEWLERMGFVYKDGATECGEERKNGVHLYVHDEEPVYLHFSRGSFNGTKVEIKYVHQLQNLYFALTGEELEIKP